MYHIIMLSLSLTWPADCNCRHRRPLKHAAGIEARHFDQRILRLKTRDCFVHDCLICSGIVSMNEEQHLTILHQLGLLQTRRINRMQTLSTALSLLRIEKGKTGLCQCVTQGIRETMARIGESLFILPASGSFSSLSYLVVCIGSTDTFKPGDWLAEH